MTDLIELILALIITALAATTAIFAIKTLIKISTKKKIDYTEQKRRP